MPHDWGVSVPPGLPTETVFEIRDKLRAGTMTIDFGPAVEADEKAEHWRSEFLSQMLAAYDREAERRRS